MDSFLGGDGCLGGGAERSAKLPVGLLGVGRVRPPRLTPSNLSVDWAVLFANLYLAALFSLFGRASFRCDTFSMYLRMDVGIPQRTPDGLSVQRGESLREST